AERFGAEENERNVFVLLFDMAGDFKTINSRKHDIQYDELIAISLQLLQGIDGFEIASHIKKQHKDIPFIFLSAKSLRIDQLKGFKLGAYDYITKPVDEELLVAKIRALIGQTSKADTPSTYELGSFHFHPNLFQLKREDHVQKLTQRENELLLMFCEHEGKLLERKKALQEIWGETDEFSRKSMDVFVSHLRKYLSADDSIKIENVHGKGFIFSVKK
ncbi:MAG: response regulator transcription factor, partial [Bacteroidota bacterium]